MSLTTVSKFFLPVGISDMPPKSVAPTNLSSSSPGLNVNPIPAPIGTLWCHAKGPAHCNTLPITNPFAPAFAASTGPSSDAKYASVKPIAYAGFLVSNKAGIYLAKSTGIAPALNTNFS